MKRRSETRSWNVVEALRPDDIFPLAESAAWELLSDIKAILDDETLADQARFHRIEAMVSAFEARGIQMNRHDW